jgi:hypothetical protein
MLHAISKWPVAISHHLWSYAITNMANCRNDTPRTKVSKTRIEMFSGADVRPSIKYHHPLSFPVYVLDNKMQFGKKIPKWMPQTRVGICLGKSPRHAQNVSLILNSRTRMASTQFHVKVDDTFQTVHGVLEISHGTWRDGCGFTREKPTKRVSMISVTELNINNVNINMDDLADHSLEDKDQKTPDYFGDAISEREGVGFYHKTVSTNSLSAPPASESKEPKDTNRQSKRQGMTRFALVFRIYIC